MVQALKQDIDSLINKIAGMVVILAPDDIQALGEILQTLDQIKQPSVSEYTSQVRSIVERLILDEYESPDMGLDELNAAVEQLQIAQHELTQLSGDDLTKKQEAILKDDEVMAMTSGIEIPMDVEDAETPKQKKPAKESEKKEVAPVQDVKPAENVAQAPVKLVEKKAEPAPQAKVEEPKQPSKAELNMADMLSDLAAQEEGGGHYEIIRNTPEQVIRTLDEDPELFRGFIEESTDNIQLIENGLIEWEANPNNLRIIDNIFRPFHTIKGVAGFLNLTEINGFAHMYEDLLDDVRKGKLTFNDQISQAVFEGVDALRDIIIALDNAQKNKKYIPHSVDLDYFIAKVSNARAGREDEAPAAKPEKPAPIAQVEKSVSAPAPAPVSAPAPKKEQNYTTPVKQEKQDPVISREVEHEIRKNQVDTFLKVSTSKMDSLIDLVGELVVTQNMVVQNNVLKGSTDKRLLRDVGQLKRITSNLQDLSMSLRMVPIKDTFQKMHRIVRDISKKSGKKIVLEMFGEETEIDRNMVEELYEPLVHMIRNNCDHGIESPEVRKQRGKSVTGTITLNAYYKGGMVVIEVGDDGNGIDTERVRQKAIKTGLCKETDILTDAQIYNFLFESGFSTSQKITDISGRGVGMDVVKKAITRLRGNIDVSSTLGKGTLFQLRLPLTLAIIDGVIVEVGSESYIIPTISIKESLVLPPKSYNRIAGKGETVFIRDRVIPLLRLADIFSIEDGVKDAEKGLLIIVESDGREAALLVDKMVDKQEIVIKSLGESLNMIPGLAGGAIMSDGNVGLIIDIPTLMPKSKITFKNE